MDTERKLASEAAMERLKTSANPGTICGILCRIYFAVEDLEIRLDCREAVSCAKRMGAKLKANKKEEAKRKATINMEAKKKTRR